jgi:ABC-type polysaccharide/polyol phosphate transport system ATPase subunit
VSLPGPPLLEFAGVSKRFCRQSKHRLSYTLFDMGRELCRRPPRDELRDGEFWSLRDVNFAIHPGEVVGVIGMNGAGKSTLMNLASGVLLPTTGSVTIWARNVCRIDHAGVLSIQETGRENILMQLAVFGIPPERNAEEIEVIARLAKLEENLDQPVGTYSRGMRSRLSFAIYSRLNPDLFLADEALGGGDRRLKDQFQQFLQEFIAAGGSMLLATHDTQAMQTLCQRVLLLDQGRQLLVGTALEAIEAYNALAQERGVDPLVLRQRSAKPVAAEGSDAVPAGAQGMTKTPPSPMAGGLETGDRPVTIEGVELLGSEESPCHRGDRARLRIRGTTTATLSRVLVRVLIRRPETRFLLNLTSPGCELDRGSFELECDLGAVEFEPGSYQVEIQIRQPHNHRLADFVSTAEVLSRSPDRSQPSPMRPQNGVPLRTTWKQGASGLTFGRDSRFEKPPRESSRAEGDSTPPRE